MKEDDKQNAIMDRAVSEAVRCYEEILAERANKPKGCCDACKACFTCEYDLKDEYPSKIWIACCPYSWNHPGNKALLKICPMLWREILRKKISHESLLFAFTGGGISALRSVLKGNRIETVHEQRARSADVLYLKVK